jgi:hypothetical protein
MVTVRKICGINRNAVRRILIVAETALRFREIIKPGVEAAQILVHRRRWDQCPENTGSKKCEA